MRAAERRWRANVDDLEALDALRVECARAGGDLPDDAVRALPRWQRLVGFARKWRARPLDSRDGLPLAKVLARERQLGFRLPAALREWYRLVGRSLTMVQDVPVKLGKLALKDGLLRFFGENQGGFLWALREEDLGHEDPLVHGQQTTWSGRGELKLVASRLSELLFAKVLWETTFTLDRRSTIGRLRKGVRGGYTAAAEASLDRRYARLPVVDTGWGTDSVLRGDSDTIVHVLEASGWAYAAARTPEAWAALEGLGFRPSGT